MSKGWIIFLIVLAVLIILAVVLYFLGKRVEKKQAAQEEQIAAAAQTVSMFIISKKKLHLKEAGLPQQVMDSVPKLMRRQKLPILKVKIGPQIMNLICDAKIFDSVPEKKEVKATVSGIYVTEVRGLRGKTAAPQEQKKKGFLKRLADTIAEKGGAKPIK